MEKLKVFKMKLSVPLPDNHEELHSEQIRCKVRAVCYTYTLEQISYFVPFVMLRHSLLLTHIIIVAHTLVTFSLAIRINTHAGSFLGSAFFLRIFFYILKPPFSPKSMSFKNE